MVAYQMHERMDGSGYPRSLLSNRIHPYAKLAMVADTFIALTSDRPHRSAYLPYYAVSEILQEASSGRLDRHAVQAFLNTVSLFPLGSTFEMNDGRVGRVVRANDGQYTRPVVEVWNPSSPEEKCILDLSAEEHQELSVLRPTILCD